MFHGDLTFELEVFYARRRDHRCVGNRFSLKSATTAPDESRRSFRASTLRARQQLEESVAARANEPPRSHIAYFGRT